MSSPQYPMFRWFVLFALLFATVSQGVILIWPAPLMQHIATGLQMDLGVVTGALMVAFTILVSVFAVVGGICLDRFGLVPTLTVTLVLLTVSTLAIPLCSHSFGTLIVARAVEGASAGPIMAAVGLVAASWFPLREHGIVTGVQGMGLSLGVALGFVFVPMAFVATGHFGAAGAWMALFPAIGVVLFLIVAFGPRPPVLDEAGHADRAGKDSDFRIAIRLPVFYVCILGFFLFSWVLQAFNDLTPVYLSAEPPLGMGHGVVAAGKFMGLVQVSFMVGSVAGGLILQKLFKGRAMVVVALGFVLAGVFMYLVKFPGIAGNLSVLPPVLICAGFFLGWVAPNLFAFISMNYPRRIVGNVTGITMGLGIFGGTVGVVVGAGLLHRTGLYQASITTCTLVGVAGFLLSFLLIPPTVFRSREKSASGLPAAGK